MEADKQAYVRVLQPALNVGGKAVLGTFAMDGGAEKCSGLFRKKLQARFMPSSPAFNAVGCGPGLSILHVQKT